MKSRTRSTWSLLSKIHSLYTTPTGTNAGTTELVTGYSVSNTALQSLLDGWLTDDLIYVFNKLLRFEHFQKPMTDDFCEVTSGICIFDPTFDAVFFEKGHCLNGRYKEPTDAERLEAINYVKQPSFLRAFQAQLCLIPVNFYKFHWSLIVINKTQSKLHYVDNLALRDTDELIDTYLMGYKAATGRNLQVERIQTSSIRQINGSDCGVLVCKFIEAIVCNKGELSINEAVHTVYGNLGSEYRKEIYHHIIQYAQSSSVSIS